MSRSLLRCRNPACPVPHGAVLGRISDGDVLILNPSVSRFSVYLDTGRIEVTCRACRQSRRFHGRGIRSI